MTWIRWIIDCGPVSRNWYVLIDKHLNATTYDCAFVVVVVVVVGTQGYASFLLFSNVGCRHGIVDDCLLGHAWDYLASLSEGNRFYLI